LKSRYKKDRKNKINVKCVSHTIVKNLKQFAFERDELGFIVTDVSGQPVAPIFNVYYSPLSFHWNTV
jgi:hypothetical protein